ADHRAVKAEPQVRRIGKNTSGVIRPVIPAICRGSPVPVAEVAEGDGGGGGAGGGGAGGAVLGGEGLEGREGVALASPGDLAGAAEQEVLAAGLELGEGVGGGEGVA